MLELNTKVNTDYIVSSCWRLTFYLFLEKVLTIVFSFFLIERWTEPVTAKHINDDNDSVQNFSAAEFMLHCVMYVSCWTRG